MKGYIKIFSFFISIFAFAPSTLAASIDYFEIIMGKTQAQVGEALDITISAVDKNGETVTDYSGDILVFSESDAEAEFPNDLAENSYSFTAANEGSVKFENAVRFQNVGVQDLYVYDLNDEKILGVAEVTIDAKEVLKDVEINILSPEDGVTLGKNNITISGTTQKNHQIRILVNNEQDYFTTTNADGIFEKEVEALQQGANTVQAFILDADNKQIGESEKINVKINSNAPEFKKITITPSGEVEAGSSIDIELVSNAGLAQVQVIINDIINTLEEEKDGVYRATTLAPSDAGEYPVDILLKDEFANQMQERGVETLIVVAAPDLTAGPEEPVEEEIIIIENTPDLPDDIDLTIKGIKVVELKSKSVLSWEALKAADSYNIYKKTGENTVTLIDTTVEPRYEIEITGDEIVYEDFAIKAIGKTASGEVIQGDLSEMTKVKTGPELVIMLLIALLASGLFFFFRRNAQA